MKLTAKTVPILTRLLVLCLLIGTLAWELAERLLELAGVTIDLTVGPVGFDIEVIALSVMANPGTIVGILPAILLFRKL
ncbi:MAG: hypothetical protein ACOC0Y_00925 [Spirochaetota bacterium]